MTDEEKQGVISEILQSLKTNSKSIMQLTEVQSLRDGDYFEVSGGRRMNYTTFLNMVSGALGADTDVVTGEITKRDVKSVTFTTTESAASITIEQKSGTKVTATLPIATDRQSGIISAAGYLRIQTAINDSKNAVSTANDASSLAKTAKSTAETALSTAQSASANADEAKETAAEAVQTAEANNEAIESNTAAIRQNTDAIEELSALDTCRFAGFKATGEILQEGGTTAGEVYYIRDKKVFAYAIGNRLYTYWRGWQKWLEGPSAIRKDKTYICNEDNLLYIWDVEKNDLVGIGANPNDLTELKNELVAQIEPTTFINVNQYLKTDDALKFETVLFTLKDAKGIQKKGVVLTFKGENGFESMQWQGGEWNNTDNWEAFGSGKGSATGNMVNVNEIAPLADGYYSRGKAALAVPDELRTAGRKITFMSGANQWQTWQFVGVIADDWLDEKYWKPELKGVSVNGGAVSEPNTEGVVNVEFHIEIDENLNAESENPVQNKAVSNALDNIQKGLAAGLSVDASTNQLTLLDANGEAMASVTLPAGGGGTTNPTAVEIVLQSTSQIIKEGDAFKVEYTWRHYNINTNVDTQYNGRAELVVNGSVVANEDVQQGLCSFDVSKYLAVGTNSIRVKITADDGVVNQSAYLKLTVVTLAVASTYNLSTLTQKGTAIAFRYVVTGSGSKVVHFELDGEELPTETITTSGATNVKTIATGDLEHGAHPLKVWAERDMGDGKLTSNVLSYDLMISESGNQGVIISTEFNGQDVNQYDTIVIPFCVYDPTSSVSNVEIYLNDALLDTMVVDRSRQQFIHRAKTAGQHVFKFKVGDVEKTCTLKVIEAEVQVEAETDALALYLSSSGRTNSGLNASNWSYTDAEGHTTKAQFINCGFDEQSGWKADEKGLVSLHLQKGAKCYIPYNPFEKDCKSEGKTIEIEFSSTNCYDEEAVLLSCMDSEVGFEITAQECYFQSALKKRVSTMFKQDERIRVGIVIENVSGKRFIIMYLNGILSNVVQYDTSDYFVQSRPTGIAIGNGKCELDIYNIRVYDNALGHRQMLNNYIADMDDTDLLFAKLDENNIVNADSQESAIDYERAVENIPCITFIGALPSFKGDKKKDTKIVYEDRKHPEYSFTCSKAQNDVQGTSSQYYPRKNWKFKFLEAITYTQSNKSASKYALRMVDGDGNLVPAKAVKTFCLKADFAESSGTHNTGAANFIGEVLRKSDVLTPPMKVDSSVRTTVFGFPILMFHQENDQSPRKFIGKYNFNNDKSTQDTYGFEGIANYNAGMVRRDDYLVYNGIIAQLQGDADALAASDDGDLMYLILGEDPRYKNYLVEYDADASSWKPKGEMWMWNVAAKNWKKLDGTTTTDGLGKVANGELVENNCECWEFTNNGSAMALFHESNFTKKVTGDDIPDWFDTDMLPTNSDGVKEAPYWGTAFEPRYPDNEDLIKEYGNGKIPAQLKRVCDWLASLNVMEESLSEDEKKAMDSRFVAEYQQYFHKEALLSYDLIREGLLAADQGAKNMMWAFFDGLCYPIFYDNDTILGINNEGRISFGPYVEPHDTDKLGKYVFNGESSALWNLIERNLEAEKNIIYQKMVSQGWTYNRALYWFNTSQSDKWPEIVYNEDAKYKYIDSFGEAGEEDGSAQNYLDIAQGSREEHRKWLLFERFSYLNAKRCAGSYRESAIYLRANTNGESTVPYQVAVTVTAAQNWYFGFRFSGNANYSSRYIKEGESYTFTAPAGSKPNDTECYIHQADRIRDLGDLSVLYPTSLVVGGAKLLESLKVGNDTEGYVGKLATLTLGYHPLLKSIDVQNCATLQTSLNLLGCPAIETVKAKGSRITAVNLAVGAAVKTLELPSSVVLFQFEGLSNLAYNGIVIDSLANIQTLNVSKCPKLDVMKLLDDILTTPGMTLQYLKITDIDIHGNGDELRLLIEKQVKGINAQNMIQSKPYVPCDYYIDTICEQYEVEEFENAIDGLHIILGLNAIIGTVNEVNGELYNGESEVEEITEDNVAEYIKYYNGETYEDYQQTLLND